MHPEQANRLWDVCSWVRLHGGIDRNLFSVFVEPWQTRETAARVWDRTVSTLRSLDAPLSFTFEPEPPGFVMRLVLRERPGLVAWMLRVVTPPADTQGEEDDAPVPANWRARLAAVREEKELRLHKFLDEKEARKTGRPAANDNPCDTSLWGWVE